MARVRRDCVFLWRGPPDPEAAPRASEAPLPYDPDALLGDVHERLVADVLHEDLRGLERTIAAKAVTYDFARPVENEPS